jgi:hypothetical protein
MNLDRRWNYISLLDLPVGEREAYNYSPEPWHDMEDIGWIHLAQDMDRELALVTRLCTLEVMDFITEDKKWVHYSIKCK